MRGSESEEDMKQLLPVRTTSAGLRIRTDFIHPLIASLGESAMKRYLEFFTAQIRNANTREAYHRAVLFFLDWCEHVGLDDVTQVQPLHVATFIEGLQQVRSAPTVKQYLAAIRMWFDWLVTGHIIEVNPAQSVHGPKHSVKRGKTSLLTAEETRQLLDSIDTSNVVGLRDRAFIALMVYTFARVGAVVNMKGEDYFPQGKRWWVRLHEKGGKRHEMPAHHNLERYIDEYRKAAGIEDDPKGFLFRTAIGRTKKLSDRPMAREDVYRMIRRRARDAGIPTLIGCHSFRATGITTYLMNGGTLEKAQYMANHESTRTTGLYDRRKDEVSLDEVERIVI